MAVYQGSRHTFTEGRLDAAGRSFLTARTPYRYVARDDNTHHVVQQGDTLFSIAGRYYAELTRPAGYWWAIADFQPVPITDPTIQLVAGSVVVVPSSRTLIEDVLGEKRRDEHGV